RIAGPVVAVDSTFATPLATCPLEYGVDLVVHSATKGLGGHNDASIGVVAGSDELIQWIWGFAILQGANASPYDATNALRGVRTLGARFRQQTESAQRIAELLDQRPEVEAVFYPGLASHPQFAVASRQMRLPGTLLTFDLRGGLEAGTTFV